MDTALQPTGLMIDLLREPAKAVLTNRKPCFSWIVNDRAPDSFQEAFQILVSSSPALSDSDEGDMWDTGIPEVKKAWATDSRSLHLPYEGRELQSKQSYWWKVRTWTGPDKISPWSEPCRFNTGILKDEYGVDTAPLTTTLTEPVCVVKTGADTWFVDFGKAAFGTVEIDADSPEEQAMQINLGEVSDGPYGINRDPGGSRRYKELVFKTSGGEETLRLEIPADKRNTGRLAVLMPKDLFEVYPFRYCEVKGYPGVLTRDKIRQVAVHYPFDDDAARFTSSSKVLNDVWEFCKYSIKATTFTGYYIDGDRERIPYEGDAYINQLCHYGCDREYAMARRTHEYLITHPNWPTEWILDSVLIAWYDYLYSGSKTSLEHFYTDLRAKALTDLAGEDGLISTDKTTESILKAIYADSFLAGHRRENIEDIVDWPQVERDGHEMLPCNSVVNAFHYRAVTFMERIADALDQKEDVLWYRKQAVLIRRAFEGKLTDPVTGLIIDGPGSTHSSLHSNMMALAFGLVSFENRSAVVSFIKSKGMACSVYGSQFLLEALYRAGEGDFALSLLEGTSERSWAHMIYDVGTTISLEAWDDRLKPNQDWNHPWGAAPAGIIPRFLMGIRSLSPGFEEILIQPQPGSLSWAQCTTPIIRGPVTVSFNHTRDQSFHMETETPANTTARVILPLLGSRDPAVIMDGRRVTGRIEDEGIIIDGVGSGRHSFSRLHQGVAERRRQCDKEFGPLA